MSIAMKEVQVPGNDVIDGFTVHQPYLQLNQEALQRQVALRSASDDSIDSIMHCIELPRAPFESEKKRQAETTPTKEDRKTLKAQ